MSIRSRLRQQERNAPSHKMALVKIGFSGQNTDWPPGARVLARQQPGGKWTVMRVNQEGITIPMMDICADVPGECLVF